MDSSRATPRPRGGRESPVQRRGGERPSRPGLGDPGSLLQAISTAPFPQGPHRMEDSARTAGERVAQGRRGKEPSRSWPCPTSAPRGEDNPSPATCSRARPAESLGSSAPSLPLPCSPVPHTRPPGFQLHCLSRLNRLGTGQGGDARGAQPGKGEGRLGNVRGGAFRTRTCVSSSCRAATCATRSCGREISVKLEKHGVALSLGFKETMKRTLEGEKVQGIPGPNAFTGGQQGVGLWCTQRNDSLAVRLQRGREPGQASSGAVRAGAASPGAFESQLVGTGRPHLSRASLLPSPLPRRFTRVLGGRGP